MASNKRTSTASGAALRNWRANHKFQRRLDYGDLDSVTFQRCVRQITIAGGAIMFGLTSDGGAFSVVVLHQDQKLKEYPNSIEAMDGLLSDLADTFGDAEPNLTFA